MKLLLAPLTAFSLLFPPSGNGVCQTRAIFYLPGFSDITMIRKPLKGEKIPRRGQRSPGELSQFIFSILTAQALNSAVPEIGSYSLMVNTLVGTSLQ